MNGQTNTEDGAALANADMFRRLKNDPEFGDRSLRLVSLVSVQGRNWFYLSEIVEGVEKGEIVEIANIHAVFMQVAENMLG